MFLVNDIVWEKYLTAPEKYLLEYCFVARKRLTTPEDIETLSDFVDWKNQKELADGKIEPLSQDIWDHIEKAVDELGFIVACIKDTSERRYKRLICDKCYKKSPRPIMNDITAIISQYCHLQDLKSSEYWDKSWERFTRARIIMTLSGDCDTQINALQMWSAENTDILTNATIQRNLAKPRQLIEKHADFLIHNYKLKGGHVW